MVISLALVLAGCATTGVVKPQLPALPKSATTSCPLQDAKPGDDARLYAAKARAAYVCEDGKRVAVIHAYDQLRTKLAGK